MTCISERISERIVARDVECPPPLDTGWMFYNVHQLCSSASNSPFSCPNKLGQLP